MKRSTVDVVMNPVRQRIAQYLMLHKTGTVSEIAGELSDIPRPSVYRHMNVLLEAGLIHVESSRQIRGAVEKTYALVANPTGNEYSQNDMALLVQGAILSTAAAFAQYFQRSDADPVRDMLSVSSCTLMLNDAEFMEMLGRIGQVYNDYIHNKPGDGRKERCLMIVSSPTTEEP